MEPPTVADERPATRAAPYLWALSVLWVLPAIGVLVGYLTMSHDVPAGRCEGIGFGCTLSPADNLVLLALLVSPFLIAAGIVAVIVIAIVQHVRFSGGRRRYWDP